MGKSYSKPSAHERKHKLGQRAGWLCHYCGRKTVCHLCQPQKEHALTTATIDHVSPRALGGTYAASNIVLACRECNGKKGSHTLPEGSTRLEIEWMWQHDVEAADRHRRERKLNNLILNLGWGSI